MLAYKIFRAITNKVIINHAFLLLFKDLYEILSNYIVTGSNVSIKQIEVVA